MRLLIVARSIRNEFKHLLHPNAVLPVRINKQTVSPSIVTTVLLFFAFYLIIVLIGWAILLFLGVGFSESVSTVISSIGNVGPGLGDCGPAYSWNSLPDLAKWVLSFLMLIGADWNFLVCCYFSIRDSGKIIRINLPVRRISGVSLPSEHRATFWDRRTA